eukprot:gnl/TRDRNA2_/TRDRNA2_130741_c1_seq4.p1 gnl/TRDRNA2_/TRDRNA2_130741_c1~~gnl/TRDRNA2_/TRDRNA2_130741_c1_seq4.p1  ORF type:complete len:194 (+),score=36.06 gnl/TRDRNA2_/TRDRNA2_130741_c1_seq4:361-942(+)
MDSLLSLSGTDDSSDEDEEENENEAEKGASKRPRLADTDDFAALERAGYKTFDAGVAEGDTTLKEGEATLHDTEVRDAEVRVATAPEDPDDPVMPLAREQIDEMLGYKNYVARTGRPITGASRSKRSMKRTQLSFKQSGAPGGGFKHKDHHLDIHLKYRPHQDMTMDAPGSNPRGQDLRKMYGRHKPKQASTT